MHTHVVLNDLANVPHRDGQDVLIVRTDTFEIQCRCHGDCYGVYQFALKDGNAEWTRHASTVKTVQRARELAARLYKAGL